MRRLRCAGVVLPSLLILSYLQYARSSTAALLRAPPKTQSDKQVSIVGVNLPADVEAGLQEVFGAQSVQTSGGDNSSGESKEEDSDPANAVGGGQNGSSVIIGSETAAGPMPIEESETNGEVQFEEQGFDTDVVLDIDKNTQQGEQEDMSVEPSAEAELDEVNGPSESGFPIVVVVGGSLDESSSSADRDGEEKPENSSDAVDAGPDTSSGQSPVGSEVELGSFGQRVEPSLSPVAPQGDAQSSDADIIDTLGPSTVTNQGAASPETTLVQPVSASPTPLLLTDNVAAVEETPGPSSDVALEDGIWVEIPLIVSNNNADGFSEQIDSSIRRYGAQVTGTSEDAWTLVEISNGTVDTRTTSSSDSWLAIYHTLFPVERVTDGIALLVESLSDGSFDEYLRDSTGDTDVTTKMAAQPILNVMPGAEVSANNVQGHADSSEVDKAGKEKDDVEKSGERTIPTDEEASRNLAIILGTGFGGVAVLIAALAGVMHFKKRAKSQGHTLDGVPGVPTTISSLDSSETGSSRYETGAPLHPRGTQVLRNQSRILDWQLEQAEATRNANHVLGRTRRDTIQSPELSLIRDGTFDTTTDISSARVVN